MGFVKGLNVIVVLGVLFSYSSLQSQEEVLWTPDFRFTWTDFKGSVPENSSAAATTASGISYDFSTYYENDELKIDYKVYTYFYPSRSWYKPQICDDVTLLHEQLHFDITELYARKLRTQLAEVTFSKNVKVEIRQRYKAILRQLNDFQNKYDSETNYSRNLPVQNRWVLEIEKALNQ